MLCMYIFRKRRLTGLDDLIAAIKTHVGSGCLRALDQVDVAVAEPRH